MSNVIGVDFGGTKIEGVLVNSKGKVLNQKRIPTQASSSRKQIISNLISVIESLRYGKHGKHGKSELKGIGIGTPGFCVNGKLTLIENISKLSNFNLKNEIVKKTKISNVVIENDAICFALAEHRYGAGKGTKNMVGIILGTGVGGGIIIDGKIYRGAIGGAGHIGHHIIDVDGPKCSCGLYGDLESYCSGTSINKLYMGIGGEINEPDASKIFASKEKKARLIQKQTIKFLAIGITNIIHILNPEMIVLGGGVSNIPFYKELNDEVKRLSNPYIFNSVKIVKNKLGDSSGVLGAAALVL